MDGTTVAERTYPWRRSSIPDASRLLSGPGTTDPSNNAQEYSNRNDPNLHSGPLTSANFSGAYNKSPEYIGDFATTTKPEEYLPRPHIRDIFKDESRTSDEKREHDSENVSHENVTHL